MTFASTRRAHENRLRRILGGMLLGVTVLIPPWQAHAGPASRAEANQPHSSWSGSDRGFGCGHTYEFRIDRIGARLHGLLVTDRPEMIQPVLRVHGLVDPRTGAVRLAAYAIALGPGERMLRFNGRLSDDRMTLGELADGCPVTARLTRD